jgi:hypothetical protein
MNIYEYKISWMATHYNRQSGIIQADSKEEAKDVLKYLHPHALEIEVFDPIFDENGICVLKDE